MESDNLDGPSSDTLDGLNDMRKQSVLCDVQLVLRDGEFRPAHRVVLAAVSYYFRVLIQRKLEGEGGGDFGTKVLKIQVKDVEPKILDLILDYCYTGKVGSLSFVTVQCLLPQADQWNITGLVKECTSFLRDHLTPENCLGVQSFAHFYHCAWLAEEARSYALWKFCKISNRKCTEFLQLTAEQLKGLMQDDRLDLPTEDDAWLCIRQWVCVLPHSRLPVLPSLLQTIRFGYVTERHFDRLRKDHFIVSHPDAIGVVNEAQAQVDVRHNQNSSYAADDSMEEGSISQISTTQLNDYYFRPRVPTGIVFALGGWSMGHPTHILETYDSKTDNWYICDRADSVPRAYHGLAELNKLIYVIGGYDGTEYFDAVRVFDPLKKTWRNAHHMHVSRCYVSVVVLDGFIYAIGGFDGQRTRLSSVERYDAVTNSWTLLADMHQVRSDASATALNGKIYVAGGFDGTRVLDTVECYDPATNHWSLVAPMANLRSGVSLVGLADEGCLMVIGGFDGLLRLSSCELYDPCKDVWIALPDMHQSRSNFATVELNGLVYVLGGFNGITTVSTVERYDPRERTWRTLHNMTVNRSAVKAVLVPQLANSQDYCYPEQLMDPEE